MKLRYSLILCFLAVFLGACEQTGQNEVVYCASDVDATYPSVVSQILPSYTVKTTGLQPLRFLNTGSATEAFDPQAFSALETGIAKHWYPQYLATGIIAIDRDMTSARINSWSDLPAAGEDVGLCISFGSSRVGYETLMAVIARGLSGEYFSLEKAASLLRQLNVEKRLFQNSFDKAIIVCYDFQAVQMIKKGRNIEIIVPSEGTFTFERGLLSNTPLEFSGDMNAVLLANGLRLLDGRCDRAFYPDEAAYTSAYRITDYKHFNRVMLDTVRVMRRDVLRIRMYSSSDGREHQLFPLMYIILVMVWIAWVINRAMQKSVRQASFLTAIILIGWILLRLVRYQLDGNTTPARYMWFSFYLFELSLPLVALWLAWAMGKQGTNKLPLWLKIIAVINGALLVTVFTNDVHNFVFHIDLNKPNWNSEYDDNIGYHIQRVVYYAELAGAVILLLIKSARNPDKKGFIFPVVFLVVLVLYNIGYSMRIPIAWESDITMVTGILTLLFLETAMRTGLIPVNSKYKTLFKHSPLGMRIRDEKGNNVLSSAALLREKDENTMLFDAPITGGNVQWQEDISSLNRLNSDIKASVAKLTAANSLLGEQEKIKREIDEKNAKEEITAQLEAEIAGYSKKLTEMIEGLAEGQTNSNTAMVALLLCYVKRRCNLFFRERETDLLPAGELNSCLNELAEMGEYCGVKIIVSSDIKEDTPARHATLFYDFFYNAIEWAALNGCENMIVNILRKDESISMWLRLPEIARNFQINNELETAFRAAKGIYSMKELDDAAGIGLSFSNKGGEK